MKLYVVSHTEWEAYEPDYTSIRGIFSERTLADLFIKEHDFECYTKTHEGAHFEVEEFELDRVKEKK